MKSIKNIIVASMAGVVLSFSGCTDLTEKPYSVLTEENIEFTDKDIEQMSGYVYSNLRFVYWAWNGWFDLQEESSDCLMTPLRIGVGWGDLYISMHKHTFNSHVGHYWTIWSYCYTGLGYANKCLDIPAVQENKLMSARLRTLRAMYYYILFDAFRNVPLETTQDLEAGYLPEQAAPQEIFDFMVSELKAAKEDLDTEKRHGIPNKYAACMTLAKIYLNHNAWFNDHSSNEYYELALQEVNEVINEGGYTLAPTYKENFMADISASPEMIFALPLDDKYGSHNYTVNKALISDGAKAFGYNGTPWNGSCAVPQFIDTYDPADKRMSDTWAHGQQYHFETGEALTTNADDQGTVPLVYTKEVHSIDNPGAYMLEGYRFVKNEIVAGTAGTYGDDVPFFRLADAYFIKAECLLRLGKEQEEAARLVTEVRKRAFDDAAKATRTVADLTGGSIYDYGHREWTSKGATVYDPAGFIATYEGGADIELGGLLDDLAWEFVGEHHRRQDLIRFRVKGGLNVYNGKSWFCKDAISDPTVAAQKDIFPIPQDFLDSNMKLKQNPGYGE